MNSSALPMLAVLLGALAGGGVFLLVIAIRGLPPRAAPRGPSRLERAIKDVVSVRGGVAIIIGILVLLLTRWVVAGVGGTPSPERSGSSRPFPRRSGSPTAPSANR